VRVLSDERVRYLADFFSHRLSEWQTAVSPPCVDSMLRLSARLRSEFMDAFEEIVQCLVELARNRWNDPVESMPKSGTAVIALATNQLGNLRRIRATYAAPNTLPLSPDAEDDNGTYDEEKDAYFCSEGWYEMNEYEDTHWKVADPVVAWCELPEVPERFRKAE